MQMHRTIRATATALSAIAQSLLETADQMADSEQTGDVIAAHFADLRAELLKPAGRDSDISDPLISRAKALKELGVSRNSEAAQRIVKRLPWVQISQGRYHVRRSALEGLKSELETEANDTPHAA